MAKLQLKNVAKMETENGEPNPMDSGIFDESGIIDESGLWEHDFKFIKQGEEKFEFGSTVVFDITLGWDSGDFTQNVHFTKQEIEYNRMGNGYDGYTCPQTSISLEVTNWVGIISCNFTVSYTLTNLTTVASRNIEEYGNFSIPLNYLVRSGAPEDE